MLNGFLIYSIKDYEKNKWFIGEFLTKANHFGLCLKLVFKENCNYVDDTLVFEEESLDSGVFSIDDCCFAINRSRDARISAGLEQLGIRVFNTSRITEIANDKWKTYEFVKRSDVRTANTWLIKRENISHSIEKVDFPIVVKSLDGHGGHDVYLANSEKDLVIACEKIAGREILVQQFIADALGDVRVYVMGGRVLAAVKRVNDDDFRANISLGGKATAYELSDGEQLEVAKVIKLLDADFVGIDFIIDDEGFVFNEIEDAVGTRSLYSVYDYDVVSMYLEYIADELRRV